ncbi:hypothetical protein ACQP25_44515 (plasmid) [Microtetraspora malaysiensis]|uniref:hypothetical protein n=1 Tax=Microtetraspora malaysiensis TaxID=161358 RepID=UPI003D8E9C70
MTGTWTPEMIGDALIWVAFAFLYGYRRGGRHARAELDRLQRRCETYARLLAPVVEGMRAEAEEIPVPRDDLATLALLAEHPGADGETLAEMEQAYGQEPPQPR